MNASPNNKPIVVLRSSYGEYFMRVGLIMGQPAAIGGLTLDDAHKFKNERQAKDCLDKNSGIGAAMERFTIIEVITPRTGH